MLHGGARRQFEVGFPRGQLSLPLGHDAQNNGGLILDVLPESPLDIVDGDGVVALDVLRRQFRIAVKHLRVSQVSDFARHALHSKDLAGLEPRLEFLQVIVVDASFGELGQSVPYRRLHIRQGFAGLRILNHDEAPFHRSAGGNHG